MNITVCQGPCFISSLVQIAAMYHKRKKKQKFLHKFKSFWSCAPLLRNAMSRRLLLCRKDCCCNIQAFTPPKLPEPCRHQKDVRGCSLRYEDFFKIELCLKLNWNGCATGKDNPGWERRYLSPLSPYLQNRVSNIFQTPLQNKNI